MRAAGMIGIVMCNASPIVPPWQGKEGRFGTNPSACRCPARGCSIWPPPPWPPGEIFKAFINGQPEIPPGWAFDSEGVPTTNTAEAYKGMLMPLGGYKGSGLALMVEILCSVLSGGAMANEVGGIRFRGRQVARQPDVHGHRHRPLHAGGGVHGAHGATGGADEIHARPRRATTK